jgi:O-6-methylguanine DNA methyltransferase
MIRLYNGDNVSRTIKFRNSFTSDFQNEVYAWLGRIPRGKVTTYGMISNKIRSGPRAVGRAVASNPWPLFVECHRVINADLTIGNYGLCGSLTKAGTATKRSLLLREGVVVNNDRIQSASLWDPSGKID